MSNFTKHPPLQPLPDGIHWEVTEEFEYHIGSEDSNEIIRVPKGFISDLASIPRIFWSLIGGPWGKYGYAAIVHDFLYHAQPCSRKEADRIFLEAMQVLGVNRFKRWIMYNMVRIFSGFCWRKRSE